VNHDGLPASLKARVLEAAKKQTSPTRTSVNVDVLLVLLTAFVAAVNVLLAAGGVTFGLRSPALVVSTTLGRGTIALAATWAALGRGGSMLGRSLPWLATTSVATPLAIMGWMFLGVSAAPTGDAMSMWHCVATTTLLGLGPLAAFATMHRQSDLAHPIATGSALGAASGAWAEVAMVLNCPASDLGHRLFCHVGPTALLVAIGAALGALVIRPSVRPACLEAQNRRLFTTRITISTPEE
jgi:hypothetical protein